MVLDNLLQHHPSKCLSLNLGESYYGSAISLQSTVATESYLTLFISFGIVLEASLIDDVILPATNEAMTEGAKKITKSEFLHWLGFWFLMGTVKGCKQQDFW